jgi:transposase
MERPNEFKIVVLDNGSFHKAKSLSIPKNIGLIFLPPYSPELNPAEKIWQTIKRDFQNRLFDSLEKLVEFISSSLKKITTEKVKSICSYKYIFSELNWSI